MALVCGLRLADFDFFQRLENVTYDLRVKTALQFPAPVATNLAFVAITESSIEAVKNGSVGFHFGLLWPRQVYGRIVEELADENSKAVALDIQFSDLRPDHPAVQMADGSFLSSD